MDSSSTKDMDSLVISGDTLAAEDSSGLAGDPVLDVLLSDSTREELDGWAVTLGLDPSDYKDKTQLKPGHQYSIFPCLSYAQIDCFGSGPEGPELEG